MLLIIIINIMEEKIDNFFIEKKMDLPENF